MVTTSAAGRRAFAGWASHPLDSAAFSPRTQNSGHSPTTRRPEDVPARVALGKDRR